MENINKVGEFITTEQIKQELESFVKEKGLTNIDVGYLANHDEGSGNDHVFISSSCSLECTHEPYLWLMMHKNVLSGKYGCSEYQLNIIKMMMERIYCRGIKFYHDCDGIMYDARSNKFTFEFRARDYTVCDLELDITFELSREGDQCKLTMGVRSTGQRVLLDRLTDNYIPCVMSVAEHHDGMILIQPLSSIDIVEISYDHVVMKDDDIAKEISIYGETFRSLFLFLRAYHDFGGFSPNMKPDILHQIHRNYEMFKKSYPGSDAYSAIETFLLQVLERSSTEVFNVHHYPSDLSILFAIADTGFVCRMNGSYGICIEELETHNKLVIKQFNSEECIQTEKSRICDFLGIEMFHS